MSATEPFEDALACRVSPSKDGASLLAFLTASFTYHTHATWAQRIASGRIAVDGALVTDAERVLRQGERVAYRPGLADDLDVTVIHQQDELVIVDKPPGAVCHRLSAFAGRTFVRRLETRLGARFEFAHRLDRGTSGLLLLARGETLLRVHDAFRDGAVQKRYRALVHGAVVWDEKTVDAPLARDRACGVLDRRHVTSDGKAAVTDLVVVERRADTTLVDAFPRTGRTHQIRVHLASLGHPVVGDALYASDWQTAYPAEVAAMRRGEQRAHCLHHARIAIELDGAERVFESAAPAW